MKHFLSIENNKVAVLMMSTGPPELYENKFRNFIRTSKFKFSFRLLKQNHELIINIPLIAYISSTSSENVEE